MDVFHFDMLTVLLFVFVLLLSHLVPPTKSEVIMKVITVISLCGRLGSV